MLILERYMLSHDMLMFNLINGFANFRKSTMLIEKSFFWPFFKAFHSNGYMLHLWAFTYIPIPDNYEIPNLFHLPKSWDSWPRTNCHANMSSKRKMTQCNIIKSANEIFKISNTSLVKEQLKVYVLDPPPLLFWKSMVDSEQIIFIKLVKELKEIKVKMVSVYEKLLIRLAFENVLSCFFKVN
jgi:hypothetical protein